MLSKRLLEISKYVDKNDSVLDLGCDHAYLSIYLKKNNLCKNVIASDISEKALEYAKENILKSNLDIHTFVSDGLNNIDEYYDTAIIAGMGTNTILKILSHKTLPNKLIISSHNEHYKLRKNLIKIGYQIVEEKIIYDNGHYYIIIKCIKGKQKLSYKYLKFGFSNNKDYYNYLYNKNKKLIKKVNFTKKIIIIYDQLLLKRMCK